MRILRSNGPRRGIGGMGWPSFRGAGVGMVRRRQGVVAGRTTYFRKALIKAVRVVVLVSRNWDPFASGEGWKVYLAEDLGILALADFFFCVLTVLCCVFFISSRKKDVCRM